MGARIQREGIVLVRWMHSIPATRTIPDAFPTLAILILVRLSGAEKPSSATGRQRC
jgi:hypothetical protein